MVCCAPVFVSGARCLLMRNSLLIAYGNWLFHWRDKVFPPVMLALFVGFTPGLFGGELASDLWLDAVGFGVALMGQGFRWLVIGLAYIKRGGLNKRVYAADLVTDGLFSHVRNPLYVGNLLILAGLFILHHSAGVYLVGGGSFLLAYIAIVAAEENYLRGKFGDAYDQYCADVPRWLPRFAGLGETLRSMRFNWQRAVLKDSASCFMWMLTALLIMVVEAWRNGGEPALAARAHGLFTAFAVMLALLLGIRLLKRQGLLRA